jgi:hypothetical protein
MSRTRTLSSLAVASTLALSSAGNVLAQDDSAADIAAARKLGGEGVTLADAGNCKDALDKLVRSERMHHAVSVLARVGECQVKLGRLVQGAETLRRVLREQLPADAPSAFLAAQDRAQRILAEAKPRIARLKVAVAAPADARIWVTIDGVNEPRENLNSDRFVDPGDHVIEAGAPGYLEATSSVHLGDGGADSVALTLQPDPNAPATAPAATPPAPPTAPAPSPAVAHDHTYAFISGGVGLVGLGFGVAFGLGALNAKSSLDGACTNKVCPSSEQGELDTGNRLATISTIGFIVGGVGLGLGAVLYFGNVGDSSPSQPSAEAPLRAHAYATPTSVGIAGSF